MPNNDITIHDVSGQVAFAQVGGSLTGDIIAGNKTIITNIIRQAAKQIVTAPYKFLSSYDISDRDIFFGRNTVIEQLVGNFPRFKTLVINGRSGSGKTSLINAGLIPRLAENGYHYISFREYSDPLRQLQEHIRQDEVFRPFADATGSLRQFLTTVTRQQQMPLVVIFDQFERFFVNVPAAVRTQFIQEIKACLLSDLSGQELDLVFALREDFFGQFTREFGSLIPAFIKETDLFDLEPLSRAEARDAILKPLEKINIKIGYDSEFVDIVLLPGLMGESTGGVTIDPPHLQIVCNQLYEQAKIRYAAKLERGGVVEIDWKLYDDLQGTTGILHNYLDDRLTKNIVPQMPGGSAAVLRSMLKAMVATTGTRKFVALSALQHALPDVPPSVIADGLRLLHEERIIETRGQDDATSYSLSHEVMVAKVQSWFDERELERKRAQETLERGVAEWQNSKALLNAKQVQNIRQWLADETFSVEAEQLLQDSQAAYERAAQEQAEREQKLREEEEARRKAEKEYAEEQRKRAEDAEKHAVVMTEQRNVALKTQSLFLADLARQESKKQNYTNAILLALEALPNNMAQPDRPYVPEAEVQLYYAVTHLRERLILKGHSPAFSPDGKRIVTMYGKTAWVWDAINSQELATLSGHKSALTSAAFSPDGTRIVTASQDNTARVWDAATGQELAMLTSPENAVSLPEFNPDGTRIVTVSNDNTMRVWDTATGQELATLTGHTEWVSSAAFSPDGTRIVTASQDNTARVWDAATGQELARLGHTSFVTSAAFSPDGTRIITASTDETARVWEIATGTALATLPCRSAAFSPDGTRIVTASGDTFREDNTARVWDAATGQELVTLSGHTDNVYSVAFNLDGTQIVTTSRDNTARVWDAVTGKQLTMLTGHTDIVWSAALSPDGTRIVTSSQDNTARVWDAVTGKQLATLRERAALTRYATVDSATFSPDWTRIVTASADHTVRVWRVFTTQELIDYANSIVPRRLTPEERKKYFLE